MIMRPIWILPLCLAVLSAPAAPEEGSGFDWQDLPELPQAMSGQMVGAHNGALIVAGGTRWPVSPFQGGTKVWLDTCYVLGEGAAEWRAAANLDHPIAYGVSVSTEDGVICAGGSDGARHYASVFRLGWANGQLARVPLPDLPQPCAYMGGAFLGNTMYVAGGQVTPDSTEALHTFWALDVTKPEAGWQALEPWPGPARILPVVAAQDGAVHVFSGADLEAGPDGKAKRIYLVDGYRFRPDIAEELHPGWRQIAGPPQAVVAAPAMAFGPTHIFVFSGDDGSLVDRIEELGDSHPGFTHDILAYHTITDSWAKKGTVPESYVTTQAVRWQDRIVIAGGEDQPGHRGARVLSGAPVGSKKRLSLLDFGVMGVYFLILILMGVYFSKREESTEDFFLGGKRIPWWAAGLSIYGTSLSAITFLAVPAESYARNWIFYAGNLLTLFVAPIVVFGYLPYFRQLNITTAYEFLERRFNIAVRLFGSCAFILFQLGRVGIVLLLPAMALSATTGISVPVAIVTMGVLCMTYTVLGGIEAVIWTDVLQVVILLAGAFISLLLIVTAIDGGASAVIAQGAAADKFRLVNWGWDISKQVLWVVVIGRFLEATIPYTSDQTIIQRYFTTATRREAAQSVWLCVFFSPVNGAMFFLLGTALFVFYKSHPHLLDPTLNTNAILPLFIVQQLPAGIAGLIIAAIFAAAMSSLDSSLNSMSAVVLTDFYRRYKAHVDETTALRLARVLTVAFGIFGTATAFIMYKSDIQALWQHYMRIIGLFGGGLAGIFALGMFTRRANGIGALGGALAGALVLLYVQRYTSVSFLLYSSIGIITSFTVGYLISLVFPGRAEERIVSHSEMGPT